MLNGRLVCLMRVERSDLKKLMEWRNNPYFRKHFREYRELNMIMQEKWYEKAVLNDSSTMMFSIRRLKDKELLGCCGFVYMHPVYRHADLSLYIGWKDSYIDEKGYAEESCRLLLEYGFKEIGLHKVWTEIYEFDDKKKKLYDKLGFKQDGFLRENYFYDGKWWNSRILSLLDREWVKDV